MVFFWSLMVPFKAFASLRLQSETIRGQKNTFFCDEKTKYCFWPVFREKNTISMSFYLFQVSGAEAKMALNLNQWKVDDTLKYLSSRFPRPSAPPIAALSGANTFVLCDVCVVPQHPSAFSYLSCRHYFCKGCWELHFECQILQGISTSNILIFHFIFKS